MLLMMGEDEVVRPARHKSQGKGKGGGGRLMVHEVSWIFLEPVRAVLTGVPPDPPFLLPFCLPTARVGGCDIFFEVTFPPFPHRRLLPRNF